uniref:tRNA-intron lyase n=1 Tax=Panagrolaimus sp. PS1159 TaxID=55785 RepID=A0AC35EYB6_9BILA
MDYIVDHFKNSEKYFNPEAEPLNDCKISITNLLENGAFLITNVDLHYELITKGFYGSRYEAQFDIKLDEKILLKGEFIWALTPEELIYLACEHEIFRVTYPTESGFACYTKNDLYREIMSRNLTTPYRFVVYRKLRSIGYVVRSDNNYGGLYTIYEGNPAKYHSSAIIFREEDNILDYSAFLRVGNTVSKAVIVPSLMTSPNLIGPNYYELAYVQVHYTLYDIQRPQGLVLSF